jgi:hypothetical protein
VAARTGPVRCSRAPGREGQVVGDAFAAQGDGHLGDRAALGGSLLGRGHRHVGGAEVDLPGAERGDARAAAPGGVADAHARYCCWYRGKAAAKNGASNVDPAPDRVGLWPPGLVAATADTGVLVVVVLVQALTASRMIAAAGAQMAG